MNNMTNNQSTNEQLQQEAKIRIENSIRETRQQRRHIERKKVKDFDSILTTARTQYYLLRETQAHLFVLEQYMKDNDIDVDKVYKEFYHKHDNEKQTKLPL